MEKNVGKTDKYIRLAIVFIIVILILTKQVDGTATTVLGVIAIILAFTAFSGFCGLYKVLGIKTCPAQMPKEMTDTNEQEPTDQNQK